MASVSDGDLYDVIHKVHTPMLPAAESNQASVQMETDLQRSISIDLDGLFDLNATL